MESDDRFDPARLRINRDEWETAQHYVAHSLGAFQKEAEAQKWISDFLRGATVADGSDPVGQKRIPAFRVFEQVRGFPIFRHHLQEMQDTVKADVLLIPLTNKIRLGAIAIEVKKSNEKIGRGISQLSDYLHSVFPVSECEIGTVPSYGFLFPFGKQNSTTASWMAQQHIGTCHIRQYDKHVEFWCGEQSIMRFTQSGWLIDAATNHVGRGMGSR